MQCKRLSFTLKKLRIGKVHKRGGNFFANFTATYSKYIVTLRAFKTDTFACTIDAMQFSYRKFMHFRTRPDRKTDFILNVCDWKPVGIFFYHTVNYERFSPVCILTCMLYATLWLKDLGQCGHWYSLRFLRTVRN